VSQTQMPGTRTLYTMMQGMSAFSSIQ